MARPETGAAGDTVHRSDGPGRPILEQIADKWSMTVLAVLTEPRRYNEIKRRVEGVTQRVLTQTLRRLERNGMISRRVLPTSPVGVEYALTPLGESLREPFGRLHAWALDNTDAIRAHQLAYDRRMLDCRNADGGALLAPESGEGRARAQISARG